MRVINNPDTDAIIKYITNINTSSTLPILKVKEGGIKKKFQMKALITAARKIGPGPKFIKGIKEIIKRKRREIA